MEEPAGEISVTGGSWRKGVVAAEVGGPGELGGKEFGYYIYGEVEDSDSYYDNTEVVSNLLQATFDMDIDSKSRVTFGGMYYDWKSNQVAGWNRLTQELVDTGLYVTGLATPLDTNGDGDISHQEYFAADQFNFNFMGPSSVTADQFPASMALDPETVGTAYLSGNQVLVAPDDELLSESWVFYVDHEYEINEEWSLTNKAYYEWYENYGTNAYGFSQQGESSVYEIQSQIAFSKSYDSLELNAILSLPTDLLTMNVVTTTSTSTSTGAISRDLLRPLIGLMATRIDDDYTQYKKGDYGVLGIALLVDIQTQAGLDLLLGVRQDEIDQTAEMIGEKTLFEDDFLGKNDDSAFFMDSIDILRNAAGSHSLRDTVGTGNGRGKSNGGLGPRVRSRWERGGIFELQEYGLKGSFLNDQLFMQLSVYEQERTNVSSQDVVTNQVSKGEGVEFEMRYLVTDALTITLGYSDLEVTNLTTLDDGRRFSFFGAGDLPEY